MHLKVSFYLKKKYEESKDLFENGLECLNSNYCCASGPLFKIKMFILIIREILMLLILPNKTLNSQEEVLYRQLLASHLYYLHKFNYINLRFKQKPRKNGYSELENGLKVPYMMTQDSCNGFFKLLGCINSTRFEYSIDESNYKNDDNFELCLFEYYSSLILFTKFFIPQILSNWLNQLLMNQLADRLKKLKNFDDRFKIQYEICTNQLFSDMIFNRKSNLSITYLKNILLASETNIPVTKYLKDKLQSIILNDIIDYLVQEKFNQNENPQYFDYQMALFIKLFTNKSEIDHDDLDNRQSNQLILVQLLNMLYNWKLKKFSYKLPDLAKLEKLIRTDKSSEVIQAILYLLKAYDCLDDNPTQALTYCSMSGSLLEASSRNHTKTVEVKTTLIPAF